MESIMRQELKEYNRIYKEITNIYHDIALKLGLSDSAFDIFYAICELGNGCLQKDICQMTFISKQTINSSIRKLEQGGYISLQKGKGRNMHIFLTELGEALMKEKIFPAIEIENQAFAEMSPEDSKEFLRLSAQFNSALRKSATFLL